MTAACFGSTARADGPDAATRSAEVLADLAIEQLAAGKYPEAIASYSKEFELSKSAVILFQVAMIYDQKMHACDLAAEYLRRYVRAPDAEPQLVQRANERLATLKLEAEEDDRRRAARTATPQPVAAPSATPVEAAAREPSQPPEADRPTRAAALPMRAVALGVGAVGLAGLGTSAVLGILAKGKNDDANALCIGTDCSNERGVTLARQAGSLATGSTVAFVAGLTLAVGGVAMYLVSPKRSIASASVTVTPDIGFSRAGMLVRGTF